MIQPFPDSAFARVLCVVAHPDDVEYGTASAIAAWTSAGIDVAYLLLTRGEAGMSGRPPQETAVLREREQIDGSAAVGVTQVEFLDYPDGVLEYSLDMRRDIARAIRRYRPDAVLVGSWEVEFVVGLNQADHRAVSLAALDAVRDAGNPWVFPDLVQDGLEPWSPRWVLVSGHTQPTHGVEVSDEALEAGVAALEAHREYLAAIPGHPSPRMLVTTGAGSRVSRWASPMPCCSARTTSTRRGAGEDPPSRRNRVSGWWTTPDQGPRVGQDVCGRRGPLGRYGPERSPGVPVHYVLQHRWSATPLLVAILAGLSVVAPSAVAPASGHPVQSAHHTCTPPPGVTCVMDIPYVDDGRTAHTLDAYYPTDLTDRASVVVIHGGVWRAASSRELAPEAEYLAQNGFAAFSINYTKSHPGDPSWPQVRTDVEAATAWVMSNAERYHGDGTRVGILGGSSGGQLAALLDTAGPEHGVAPQTIVTWSGAMDLTLTYNRGNGTARRGLGQLFGCSPTECPHKYDDASPVTHVTGDDGSMLLFHSSDERVPVAVAYEMNRALNAAAVPHRLVVFKDSGLHGRQYECDPATVLGQTWSVIDDAVRWFGAHLEQPSTPTDTFCAHPGGSPAG